MTTDALALAPDNLQSYLASRGLLGEDRNVSIRELGGGVSNIVLLIEWPRQPGRRWVVKQALGKLRVQDDWRSDRDRVFREAESIRALRPVLSDASLPEIIYIDRENYLFIMTAAPEGFVAWKEDLLAGRVDLSVARQVGALLGRLIGAARADSHMGKQLRERFQDRRVFDQLRIDPYYRTTAARHPDVREALEELIRDSWKIQLSLVHGDFSPKNILVQKDQKIFLIDLEVIHWGDPAFDAGFLLNHLVLKAFYQPHLAQLYMDAAREFWKTLLEGLGSARTRDFEVMTLRHLGGLMLARIDGKSPVEYIRDEETKERVRRAAKRIIRQKPSRLEEAVNLSSEDVP